MAIEREEGWVGRQQVGQDTSREHLIIRDSSYVTTVCGGPVLYSDPTHSRSTQCRGVIHYFRVSKTWIYSLLTIRLIKIASHILYLTCAIIWWWTLIRCIININKIQINFNRFCVKVFLYKLLNPRGFGGRVYFHCDMFDMFDQRWARARCPGNV